MPIKQLYLTPTHPFYDEFITLENQKLLLYCYFTEGSTDQLTVRAKMCLLYLIILKVPRHAVAMWPYILHLCCTLPFCCPTHRYPHTHGGGRHHKHYHNPDTALSYTLVTDMRI